MVIYSKIFEYVFMGVALVLTFLGFVLFVGYMHIKEQLMYYRDDLYYHRKLIRRLMEHIGVKSVLEVEQKPEKEEN